MPVTAPARPSIRPCRPGNEGLATLYHWPQAPRAVQISPDHKERGGVFYQRRAGARFIAALLGSVLAHTGLIVQWGEPSPLPIPPIPPRIRLELTVAPPPPIPSPAPVLPPAPVMTPEAAPPVPMVEAPPPPVIEAPLVKPKSPLPVVKAPPTKPKPAPVKPRPRSTVQHAAPKAAKPPVASIHEPAVTVPSPRPLAGEGLGVRAVDSTVCPLTLTLSPTNGGEGTECLQPLPLILNPRYRHPPAPPVYPSAAIRLDQQGTVLVQARISTTGEVIEVSVHQSSGHRLLDAAALAAVRRYALVPATRNGAPVEAWVRIPVHFVLNHR